MNRKNIKIIKKSRSEIKRELLKKDPDNYYFEEERIRELRKQNKEEK